MPLETASYPSDLVSSNPAATDPTNQGDDHIRLLKNVWKTTFPNISGAVTATHGALNYLTAGGLRAPDGAAGAPGISFGNNTAIGFYRSNPSTVTYVGTFAFAGDVSVGGAMTVAGALGGSTANFSGAITANGASLGPVSGSSGTFSGTVSAATFVGAHPAGAIEDFAGDTAPTGWAVCDGQALSRTTYAQLFAYIGTKWGAGDGSTTFNVPNLQDRFRRHRSIAGNAGAVGTVQSPANLAHTHTYSGTSSATSNDHTHTFSGTSGTESATHTHGFSGTSSGISVDHTHGISLTSGAMSANSTHTHTIGNPQNVYLTSINNGSLTNQGNVMVTGGGSAVTVTTSTADLSHTHAVTGSTGGVSSDHTHTYSGTSATESATHTHAYSGTTSGVSAGHTHTYSGTTSGGSADNVNEARPYSATMLTCIKLFN